MRPTLPRVHPYGPSNAFDEAAYDASLYENAARDRAKPPRRPRGVEKAWWFHADQGYRKRHYWCCIASAYYCPFCGKLDWDQNDGCKLPQRDTSGASLPEGQPQKPQETEQIPAPSDSKG